MTISTVKYTCGCGFKSESRNKAEEHVTATGHSVIVSGELRRNPRTFTLNNVPLQTIPEFKIEVHREVT